MSSIVEKQPSRYVDTPESVTRLTKLLCLFTGIDTRRLQRVEVEANVMPGKTRVEYHFEPQLSADEEKRLMAALTRYCVALGHSQPMMLDANGKN